jgi:hypothetical protein
MPFVFLCSIAANRYRYASISSPIGGLAWNDLKKNEKTWSIHDNAKEFVEGGQFELPKH